MRLAADSEGLLKMKMEAEQEENNEDKKTGGIKAKIYYTFRLEVTKEDETYNYSFVPLVTELTPEMDIDIKDSTTYRIDYSGKMSHCHTRKGFTDPTYDDHRIVDVEVKCYRCHEEGKEA